MSKTDLQILKEVYAALDKGGKLNKVVKRVLAKVIRDWGQNEKRIT